MIWPTKKLSEICDFQNGLWKGKKPPLKKVEVLRNTNFRNGGYLDLDNVAEIEAEKKQLAGRLLQKGDLILERSGGGPTQPVGRVVYFDAVGDFSFSNFTTRIRVKDPIQLYSKYLWRYLNQLYISGVTETMQKQTTGIRNLNFSGYKNLGVPLPPIDEQKRIVEKIEKLFAKIDEASCLRADSLAASASLLPSALQQIFSRAEKGGWEEKELSELFEITSSKRVFKSEWRESGIPFYRARELVSLANKKPFKSPIFISEKMYEQYKSKYGVPKEGDILVTGVGTIGVSYVVKSGDKFYFKDGNIIWLKKISDMSSRFVEYFFSSSTLRDQLRLKSGGATVVGTLTITTAKSIKIPLPPTAEQKKIVVYLDNLSEKARELQELQKAQLADFAALRQSILIKAFGGKS